MERIGRKFFAHQQNEIIANGLKSGSFNPTTAVEKVSSSIKLEL
jgi:hypothetical protein